MKFEKRGKEGKPTHPQRSSNTPAALAGRRRRRRPGRGLAGPGRAPGRPGRASGCALAARLAAAWPCAGRAWPRAGRAPWPRALAAARATRAREREREEGFWGTCVSEREKERFGGEIILFLSLSYNKQFSKNINLS